MFEVEVSHEGSVRTIGLIGECDLQMFPDVDELFSKSLDNGFSAVRIDLRGLTFIDSSGIRALMLATQQSQKKGAKLSIIPGPPQVMRVFELLGLQDAFPFEGRRESAEQNEWS
jgi:anti-anti-sigma factor